MLGRIKFQIEPLVNEILDQLPAEVWSSKTTTFFDPAMGGGQFVREIERRLREAGHTDVNISGRVYGCESSLLSVKYAVNKYKLAGTYSVGDFLAQDFGDMKFDVIVGNPPYNSNDTSRENTQHRGQGDNLAKKFTLRALELSKKYLFFIIPYGHRTYSTALQKTFQKNGLYKILPCKEHFQLVTTNPCVFYFNKSTIVPNVDDQYNNHNLMVPKKNIGDIFKNQPGQLNRVDYEHKLTEKGLYRIVVTTNIIKYTDDVSIINGMKDPTVGNWRVVFNCTTSVGKFGKIIIEGPESILSKSVHCLIVPDQKSASFMKEYLETEDVKKILAKVKLNACNSKKFLQYIPMPK
jgi:hypothetical protein